MFSSRSIVRSAAPMVLGGALALLGPGATAARGQWLVPPGFGIPYGGYGFGYGYGYGHGFGPTRAGVGYGFGPSWGAWPGYGVGYGLYPSAFNVLNQADVRAGLAYNALATGRAAPLAAAVGPFGFEVGPYGYAGASYFNPYFSSGLTPLAVRSARDEPRLRGAGQAVRFRLVPIPPAANEPGAGRGADRSPNADPP
ncbi:hypothetical protein [Tautonia sociabilis]|uniref:Uncharacterized protein n=1 Tax=Tautonia sociabilis TaxID=2080755 RepID=A0A432MJX2_9BACT|nr:hypothetical protein [Tautonia sociabilis]RUL87549.1 hypothetical protein TsocGM_11990 [Tautonia sociabilis]